MTCPNCGLNVEAVADSRCPRCGWLFQAPHAAGTAGAPAPGGDMPSHYPPYAPPAPPAPPSPLPAGQPGSYPSYPAYPPAYGVGYGPPVPPGYPPPWGPPGAFPPPPPPLPPRKRSSGPLIASVVALAAILVLAIAGGSAYVLRQRVMPQASTLFAPTATPTTPGMNGRTALTDDPLTGQAPSWPTDAHCFDSTDGYHIKDAYFCYPGGTYVSNATISVQAELRSGPFDAYYGIAFRIVNQPTNRAYYFFGVSPSGNWAFGRQNNDTWVPIVAPQPSAAIPTGLQQFSTLTVNATGSHFDFYIGQTQVGSADDYTLTEGPSGLTIYGPGEAVFTNFIVAN